MIQRAKTGAFRVLCDTYVTDDSGTGIVHSAPAFGEDDYRCCIEGGVIRKGEALVCPIDASGKFTDEVKEWKGEYVKDADSLIIKHLKEKGRLIHESQIDHSYPFCWRSETPLLYRVCIVSPPAAAGEASGARDVKTVDCPFTPWTVVFIS